MEKAFGVSESFFLLFSFKKLLEYGKMLITFEKVIQKEIYKAF